LADIKLNDNQCLATVLAQMGQNLIVIGPAGTGKSVVIDELKKKDKSIVLAPTARAATNVGGSTIHSYFGLKHEIQTPKSFAKSLAGREKPERIIIDEFWMVRADVVDVMDRELRRVYNDDRPLAGIQTILVGDYFQLQPIVSNKEREKYYMYYNSAYAFSSNLFREMNLEVVRLDEVVRQSDPKQARLLESIRVKDKYWRVAVDRLNSWCPEFNEELHRDYMQLCFYNRDVDKKNEWEYSKLKTEERIFVGRTSGEFEDLPVPKRIALKVGCQIVVCSNGMSTIGGKPVGKFFNGMVGVITGIKQTHLELKLENGKNFKLSRHTWNKTVMEGGTEKVVGSFRQYPVKLGWAVSVHSSQGMTLGKYVLDTGRGAFADALVYVGLSRAKDLKEVVLKKRLNYSDIKVSREVLEYDSRM
jgi:ATP-dependent DNA helicase PIF1